MDKQYKELKDLIKRQNDFIHGLSSKIDQQQYHINHLLKERDELLMQSMSHIKELILKHQFQHQQIY